MIGGLLGLLAMHAVFSPSAWVIAIQVVALLLGVWARVTFGRRSYHVAANPTEGCLVTWGPYRYIRHPIYTAICVATLAGVGAHWSWKTGACGAVVAGTSGGRGFWGGGVGGRGVAREMGDPQPASGGGCPIF